MYLQRLIIITAIVLGLAFLGGKVMDGIYKKRWETLWFEKTNELVNSTTKYDLLFLGNSRVHFAINPFYVDSVTRLSSYNFGTGGADAGEMLLIAKSYLSKHPAPNLALISLDPGILFEGNILKTRYHYLFYLDNENINKSMHNAGFQTGLIRSFPFLKYSFFDEYNRTSIFVKGNAYPRFDHNQFKGFLNVHQSLENNETKVYNPTGERARISTEAISNFDGMIKEFRAHGCTLLFIWPPLRSSARDNYTVIRQQADSIFSSLAKQYKIPSFHFENDQLYDDKYFVDEIHFNEPGTRIYSRAIGDTIVQYLNYKN